MASFKIGDSRVLESRDVGDGMAIRRRREAPNGNRFTTYERIEKPNLAVIKKNGSRELFVREKLTNAVHQSVGKFFKSEDEVNAIVDNVEKALYDLGEMDIPSSTIGNKVLDELARVNEVAYVRFASVYYEFQTLDEFEMILMQRRVGQDKK